MNDAELEQLLDDIESDRAERTESTTDGDKFRQAVCAFANDLPDHRTTGVLFVGVNGKGEPTGIAVTDQLLQNLASIRGDGNVLPFPSLDVQKRKLKGNSSVPSWHQLCHRQTGQLRLIRDHELLMLGVHPKPAIAYPKS